VPHPNSDSLRKVEGHGALGSRFQDKTIFVATLSTNIARWPSAIQLSEGKVERPRAMLSRFLNNALHKYPKAGSG